MDELELNQVAWERVAEAYSCRQQGEVTTTFRFFCESLPDKAKVLDVGCGDGLPNTLFLADYGFQVECVDISSKMISMAKENVPSATYRKLSMTDLDYKNEFDGIVSAYSMLLLTPSNFRLTASKMVDALKNQGLMYLSLNEPDKGHEYGAGDFAEIMGERMYSRPYKKEEVVDVFTSLGMKLLAFERQTMSSKEFGVEYMMEFVFKKINQ